MTARLTVVGLGPAGAELVTTQVMDAVAAAERRFVRTVRHPAAAVVTGGRSFDDLYESASTLDEVYAGVVEALVAAAEGAGPGELVYAVPGSPWVAERTVELLLRDPRVEVDVLPGLSFVDLAWARLRVDPVAVGARLVDGQRFAVEAAGERGPLLVAQCDRREVLSEIKLAVEEPPTTPVTVLQRLGLPDESLAEVAWDDIDRYVEPDHLTALWIPELAAPVGRELIRFAELSRTLRERCPWDREQTHRSLTRHLLEETYEVLEAIEAVDEVTGEGLEHLEEELGDLLFQVVFHSTLGAEAGAFTLADVARGIHDKLVRRHPHVFGDVNVDGTSDVVRNWEQIKREEKGRSSVLDGVPGNLPSLLYAHKIQRKASSIGEEVDVPPSIDVAGLDGAEAVGAALFALVAAARRAGVDPETALRQTAARYRDEVAAREAGGHAG